MAAVYVNNITINAGEDFSQELTISADKPVAGVLNLVGYAGSSMIRKHASSSKVVAGFGVSFVNRSSGLMRLSLGSSITSTLKEGRYVYDVVLINNAGLKSMIVEGMVLIRTGITT